jgi:anti-sigma regulatory factor (Ser/Thr protein kinase)
MRQTFPRDIGALEAVFGFMRRFRAEAGFGDRPAYALHVAVEEFFTNIVKYGRGGTGEITIEAERVANAIVVKIEERTTQPFDVTRPTQTQFDRPPMERRPGGLGVYLAKELLDDLSFEFASGISRIVMTKQVET